MHAEVATCITWDFMDSYGAVSEPHGANIYCTHPVGLDLGLGHNVSALVIGE